MEIKYYLGSETSAMTDEAKEEGHSYPPSFLALKIKPTTKNMLKLYKRFYNPGSENMSDSYLLIEFELRSHLEELVGHLFSDSLEPFLVCAELQQELAIGYWKALAKDDVDERRRDERKAKRSRPTPEEN